MPVMKITELFKQSNIHLISACLYLLEADDIGTDTSQPAHETFGHRGTDAIHIVSNDFHARKVPGKSIKKPGVASGFVRYCFTTSVLRVSVPESDLNKYIPGARAVRSTTFGPT